MNTKYGSLVAGLVLYFFYVSHGIANVPIIVGDRDIYEVIREAPAHSTLLFDLSRPITLNKPIVIDKPLTLRGLHARLPEDLAGTPLIFVTAEGFTIDDFELHGNATNLSDDENRTSLLVIIASNFLVKNGLLKNSTQHGVLIATSKYYRSQIFIETWGGEAGCGAESGIVKNGVVRDLIGESILRDVVSLTARGGKIRHVLVENIRSFGGSNRGAVEVADGSENVIVRNIYAEDSRYALDIMHDHGKDQINRNHYAENIHAVRCIEAVRTANHDSGHVGLTLRNITAENCVMALNVSNIIGVTIDGVRVIDHQGGSLINISNVHGLIIRDVSLLSGNLNEPAIQIRNSTNTRVEDLLDSR